MNFSLNYLQCNLSEIMLSELDYPDNNIKLIIYVNSITHSLVSNRYSIYTIFT